MSVTARTMATGTICHDAIIVDKSDGPSYVTFTMVVGYHDKGNGKKPHQVRVTVRSYRADHKRMLGLLRMGTEVTTEGRAHADCRGDDHGRVWATAMVAIDEDDRAGKLEVVS